VRITVQIYVCNFYPIPLVLKTVLVPVACCFNCYDSVVSLKSGIVILPALYFLLNIALAICGLLCFHMNVRVDFSTSVVDSQASLWTKAVYNYTNAG
jgi:hypothetical protein